MDQSEVEKYSNIISKIIGKENVISQKITDKVISDYYTKSAFLYTKFHSKEGAMHLPIKLSDEASHKEKLLYQAESINEIIIESDYSNILELGCGMGFNTQYLAQKNPSRKFTGIDLTPNNIKIAKRKLKNLDNVSLIQMDFDVIQKSDQKYDLIFAIETICHSKDFIQLIRNLSNRLTEHGRIIIFDGYMPQAVSPLTKDFDKHAYNLLLWGFALDKFQKITDVFDAENLNGLKLLGSKDLTENVLANAKTFQDAAFRAFKYAKILRILLKTRIIPLDYIKQFTAGAFTHYFISMGYLGYFRLEFKKSN